MKSNVKYYKILKNIYSGSFISTHQYITTIFRPFYAPISEIIEWVPINAKVLDIGSGTGLLLFLLQDVIGIDKSYGFDINEKSINIAKLVNPYKHIKFKNSNNMNNILKDINIVTMIDVLHHVPQKEKIPFLLNILNQIPRGSQIIIKDLDPLPRWMAIANRITDYFSTNSKVSYISSNEIGQILLKNNFDIKYNRNLAKHVWSHYLIVGVKK